MQLILVSLIIVGLLPLTLALRANRGTSLFHAIVWTIIAWLSWGLAFWIGELDAVGVEPTRYCALCLTGCAGVAVLGARRPHVMAWDFVVLGLVAVLVLPLLQTWLLGTHPVEGLRIFFLASTLTIGILNYLPTRLAPAAVLLLLTGAGEITLLYAPEWLPGRGEALAFHLLLTATPWIGWICLAQRRRERPRFDQVWLAFRDRWGLVWGQRVREQFNHAAEHAGWPVKLYWRGLVLREKDAMVAPAEREKMLATLCAALQRFIAANEFTKDA